MLCCFREEYLEEPSDKILQLEVHDKHKGQGKIEDLQVLLDTFGELGHISGVAIIWEKVGIRMIEQTSSERNTSETCSS